MESCIWQMPCACWIFIDSKEYIQLKKKPHNMLFIRFEGNTACIFLLCILPLPLEQSPPFGLG